MSNILLTCKMSSGSKIIEAFVGGPLLCVLGGYGALMTVTTDGSIIFTGMCVLIFCIGVLCPFSAYRYILTITDDYVEQTYWKTTRINYSEIIEVNVGYRAFWLCARGKKFETLGFITEREKALTLVATHLRAAGREFKLTGDRKQIEKYFSLQVKSR